MGQYRFVEVRKKRFSENTSFQVVNFLFLTCWSETSLSTNNEVGKKSVERPPAAPRCGYRSETETEGKLEPTERLGKIHFHKK